MSKYNGLDKLTDDEIRPLCFIESYRRVKIYNYQGGDHPLLNPGYVAVSRKYVIDSNLRDIKHAKKVIDHFHEPISRG